MSALDSLIAALEGLGIRYLIGGSLASSSRGVLRATMDVDVLAEMRMEDAQPLATALGSEWYADPADMRRAISAGRAFNVIHLLTSEKFDLFPASGEFHASELRRATEIPLHLAGSRTVCRVATAEDILLAKLQWYRQGGEVSERQWSDILGILAANLDLDRDYLNQWTIRLNLGDLWERARREAGWGSRGQ
ncbi:MAG: hypothetical protein ACLQVN_13525 [Bryobacteraceae bacterium]